MTIQSKALKNSTRTYEQLVQQYETEKKLADILRNATKDERRHLYTDTYDTLYQQVPHHPQLTRKVDSLAQTQHVLSQMRILRHFLASDYKFVEVGSGDCSLAFEVARQVRKVYSVEISEVITKYLKPPENYELVISDGCSIPIPLNSINVVYSNQLMEHLHPDDAFEQLQNIYNILVPGGIYFCITPNRLNGPHDISKYFDEVATGLHLKEYTNTELEGIFKKVGFRKVRTVYMLKGLFFLSPPFLAQSIETVLSKLPGSIGKRIAYLRPFKLLLGIKLVAFK